MVPRWKKLSVRVFITVGSGTSPDNVGEVIEQQEEMVNSMLDLLRIKATSHVLIWNGDGGGGANEADADDRGSSSGGDGSNDNGGYQASGEGSGSASKPDFDLRRDSSNSSSSSRQQHHSPYRAMSEEYLNSACQTVRRRSADTAVAFLYLPPLPEAEADFAAYFDALTRLTQGWPPTLLVRGVSPVTSITL